MGKIGEGTYGVVLKCKDKTSNRLVAIKKFKERDEDEQVRESERARARGQCDHARVVWRACARSRGQWACARW